MSLNAPTLEKLTMNNWDELASLEKTDFCYICNQPVELGNFYNIGRNTVACKPCHLVRVKTYQKTPSGRISCKRSVWKYNGILFDSEEEFLYWFTRYENAQHCEICQLPFKSSIDRNLDHNHHTGKPRGVICTQCNTALGVLENNNIERLLGYLDSRNAPNLD